MTDTARLTGALSDRYRIERELGQGGMATVYLAHDLKHDRKVAIKVVRTDVSAGIDASRFLREIRTISNLQHPHILGLLDSGALEGTVYYVMPYIAGGSLRDRLQREKQLPIGDAIRITRDVAAGLDYAHRQGVIHRDIKPENILLHDGGAMVADFGIALSISGGSNTRLTETGASVGTPGYMSPEQAMGERDLSLSTDIFSLGCVLYEMLVGEPPFSGPTLQSIVAMVLTGRPVPASARRDTVSPPLEQVIATAIQKLPADRFGSAAGFAAALAAIGSESPIQSALVEHAITNGTFRLTEDVCRRLARSSFDHRLIGTDLHYLDNGVRSEMLACFIPACGRAADQYTEILHSASYRVIATTFRGFEPRAAWRPRLTLDDHIVLVREFLRDTASRLQPRFVVIAGFSSGGDFALRFAAAPDPEQRLRIDGCLTLGQNLSHATCFLTSGLAKLESHDHAAMLAVLRGVADGAASLDEWTNICDYVAHIVPVFRENVGPLRAFAADISAPFEHAKLTPFASWYREAAEKGCKLRCVFEDTPMYRELVRELQLRNLDEGLLGPRYEEQSVISEAGTSHFDLIQPPEVGRHMEALQERMRAAAMSSHS